MLLAGLAHSQFCGNSGPGVCTPQYYVADTSEWFSRPFDSLPCIARNMPYNESVTLRCDSLPAVLSGQLFYFQVMFEIDSIVGLPNGICWATNDLDNRVTRDWICINFNGTTTELLGNYECKMHGYSIPNNVPTIPEIEPYVLPFTLRVREASDPCVSIASSLPTVEKSTSYNVSFNERGLIITTSSEMAQVTITDLTGQLLEQMSVAPSESASISTNNYHGMLLVTIAEKSGTKTYKLLR